jgi:DNA-directed RNA polymerase specialized sigma24 family protein
MAAAAASTVDAGTSDAHLVIKAQDGDRDAFEELFRRHAHPAWRLALAVGGHREAAETAVAEGFTAAFRQLSAKSASAATPFRLLVVRATFDAACLEARRAPATAASTSSDNEAISAFRRLPERWRAALWLTAVEGGTAAQVGPLLGLSEDAAASLARKAEAGLRERLLHAAPQVGATLDVKEGLRPLVIGLPAGLRSAAAERWSAWRDEQHGDHRWGLLAMLPGGGRMERVIAIAASAVVALGVLGALSLRDSSGPGRAPLFAAPAAAAPATSTATAAAPHDAARKLTIAAPQHAGRVTTSRSAKPKSASTRTVSGEMARAAAASAPAPATAAPPAAAPAPPPEDPAASADPGPSVAAGTTVAGEPVSAGAGADGSGGVQVGPVVVGSPPPADESPSVTIDTGILPTISLPL